MRLNVRNQEGLYRVSRFLHSPDGKESLGSRFSTFHHSGVQHPKIIPGLQIFGLRFWLWCLLMIKKTLNLSKSKQLHHSPITPSSFITPTLLLFLTSSSPLSVSRSAVTPPPPPPPSTTPSMRTHSSQNPQRVLSLTLDPRHRQDNFLGLLPWRLSGVQAVMMPLPPARSRLSLQEAVQSSKWRRSGNRRTPACWSPSSEDPNCFTSRFSQTGSRPLRLPLYTF